MAAQDSDLSRAERASLLERMRVSGPGRLWLLAAGIFAVAAFGAHWVYYRWTHVYLDDARIDGEVVTVSSRVSGWIADLPVIDRYVLLTDEK